MSFYQLNPYSILLSLPFICNINFYTLHLTIFSNLHFSHGHKDILWQFLVSFNSHFFIRRHIIYSLSESTFSISLRIFSFHFCSLIRFVFLSFLFFPFPLSTWWSPDNFAIFKRLHLEFTLHVTSASTSTKSVQYQFTEQLITAIAKTFKTQINHLGRWR